MQVLVNGLILGLTIGLLSLAFTVAYLPTRVFHVALGGVYACTPFIAWSLLSRGYPWRVAIVVSVLVAVGLSTACEALNHGPLERKGASSGIHLVSSLGIYIIFVQLIAITWGNEPKVLRTGLDSITDISGLILTRSQILAGTISAMLLLGFFLWLRLSNLGLQFRALADNPTEMSLRGYSVGRLRLLSFGLSGLLAGACALLYTLDVGFDPHVGLPALLLAIVGMIIGGRQSFVGSIIGGILLGMVRSEVVRYLSSTWLEAITFILLAGFLLLKPNGLMGQKHRLEADA